MERFNVFYFKEYCLCKNKIVDDSLTDNNLIVLYDEKDGNFYYYGTRNRKYQTTYKNYSGKFHYTKLEELVQFMDILMDGFITPITTELHQVYLNPDKYNQLDFSMLKNELSSSTELAAYDKKIESFDNLYTYLQTLISHK